jgi:hypothetical protein
LYYGTAATGNNFNNFYNATGSTSSYVHTLPNNLKGKYVMYKAIKENFIGSSDEARDFIYLPYRDHTKNQPVYIKKIYVPANRLKEIEGWIAGSPEFYLKVVGVSDNNAAVELNRELNLKFSKRGNTEQSFSGQKATDWFASGNDNETWLSTLTFSLIEYDRPNLSGKVSFGATRTKKGSLDIETTVTSAVEFKFSNDGRKCGQASLRYFDDPNGYISFNYGINVYLGMTP